MKPEQTSSTDTKPMQGDGGSGDPSIAAIMLHQMQLLHATLNTIDQGVLTFDTDLRLVSFNTAACTLLDVDDTFFNTLPTLVDVDQLLLARGHASQDAEPAEQALIHRLQPGALAPPDILHCDQTGRTLEVKTHALPSGGLVRTYSDVSGHVRKRTERSRSDQLLIATQAMAQVGGWEADMRADQVYWTDGIYRIMETTPQDYQPGGVMATAARFFTPASLELLRQAYFTTTQSVGSGYDHLELEAITARGRPIWILSRGTSRWHNGSLLTRTSVIQDITDAKNARTALLESESRWKLALESTGDGVWDWHIPSGVEFFSRRLIEMYGFREGEIANLPGALDARTHPDDIAQLKHDRLAHINGQTPTYLNEHRILCKDGQWKWVLSRGMVINRDSNGHALRMIGTHTDITERKTAEALVRQQAYFDTLTGLPNRRMLRDRLEQEIKKCKRTAQQLAILFIDLDHFKEVNDTLGHDRGDQLLIEAARRITACIRETDTVARMGGDEFTVLLTDINASDQLQPVLQKLLHSMDGVFELGDEQVFVTASIGITLYPLDATEIDGLFRNADQALYVAKGEGRNRFSFFTPALQAAAQTRVRLAADLRTALSESQFHVAYQPIVELSTGAIRKAEALLRWNHPKRGAVGPADFIPIAESSGLIVDIGEWVFQQAAAQVQLWRKRLHPQFQISVNRSPVQFHHSDHLLQPWGKQLQTMGLPGDALVVEITEGLLLDTSAEVANYLMEMAAAGIQVSLDDFGTGYSSLAYLQKFDIDFIKIDKSFVRHLTPHCTNLSLCKAIIVMAHELGMQVVAEGVETEQERDLLIEAGCDFAQGYLFSRPISADAFEALVRQP